MGRSGTVYLTYTALVLLSTSSRCAACLWCVNIDESPAPPLKDVPPFSRHATRDRALLPYQIIGVVSAYVASVLVAGTLLLTVGRSMRKHAQNMSSRPQEMIKPLNNAFDPSPISPASQRSWYKLRNKTSTLSNKGSLNERSPGVESVASFDKQVLEADRARMQSEMERLYAAVMDQEDRKSAHNVSEIAVAPPLPPPSSDYYGLTPAARVPTSNYLQPPQATPQTSRTPVRAVYPHISERQDEVYSPITPISPGFAEDFYRNQPQSPVDMTRLGSPESTRSVQSTSSNKKSRKGLRNLTISPPLQSPTTDGNDGARTPLPPRAYINPGLPPEPPTARSIAPPLETPGTERMFPLYAGEEEEIPEEEEHLDEVPALPSTRNRLPDPPKTPRITTNFSKPAVSTAQRGALPLREMNRQYAAQTHAAQHTFYPLSPSHWNNPRSPLSPSAGYLTSAGPVKTTFVEARRDRFLGAPRTGQATPYSAYMPFTPVTPITPHLTSRAERKQRAREDRAVRGALTEEDAVAEESDMWDSGY